MRTPQTYEELVSRIAQQYDAMGKAFRQAAECVVQHPNEIAMETVKTISTLTGVPATNLVRFAKSFGFSGFTEMQRLFQSRLVTNAAETRDILRGRGEDEGAGAGDAKHVGAPCSPLEAIVDNDIVALQNLRRRIAPEDVVRAASMIVDADCTFIIAMERSFASAYYLNYGLSILGCRSRLLGNLGGMARHEANLITSRSVLFAQAFPYYARDTLDVFEYARQQRAQIISLTDTVLSPISSEADIAFYVPEAAKQTQYTIAATIAVCEAIIATVQASLEGRNTGRAVPAHFEPHTTSA